MKTDLELEATLRETFGVYAGTITDGPTWHGAETMMAPVSPQILASAGAAPLFADAREASSRAAGPGSQSRRAASRRWQTPLIAAAAVAAVALATAILAPRLAHETAGPAAGGASVTASASDTAGGAGGSSVPAHPGVPAVTATVGPDGAITVAAGDPGIVVDLYTDALCPICGEFEQAYGAALDKAVDDGELAVRYRFVDFLNGASASGDYSTRAYAALLTVARDDEPAVFTRFVSALFDPAHQPAEQSSSDLSDHELAALARNAGASTATQQAIAAGAGTAEAHSQATATLATLRDVAETVGRAPGTPTVAVNGTPVSTNSPDWLAALLGEPAS